MSAGTVDGRIARTPWHLWALGGLSLLWHLFGAYDYLMMNTRNAGYLANVAGWMFSALILGVMVGLAVYSRWMTKRGVLR